MQHVKTLFAILGNAAANRTQAQYAFLAESARSRERLGRVRVWTAAWIQHEQCVLPLLASSTSLMGKPKEAKGRHGCWHAVADKQAGELGWEQANKEGGKKRRRLTSCSEEERKIGGLALKSRCVGSRGLVA